MRSGEQDCAGPLAESGALPPAGGQWSEQAAGAALPCLNCNNSNETALNPSFVLTGGAKRTAYALQENVRHMADFFGIENIGFLTLTFADHVTEVKEASRRFNSLAAGVLRERYRAFIRVLERQKSGRIHYHLLVALPEGTDIRTGVSFSEIEQRNYQSAPESLRAEWAFWRHTAKRYRFGRTELMPIYSSSEAIGKYVGKYISKHLGQREERDKGARLVTYSGQVKVRTRFAWVSPGATRWRLSLGSLCWAFYEGGRIPLPNEQGMRLAFGQRWLWRWKDVIASGADFNS